MLQPFAFFVFLPMINGFSVKESHISYKSRGSDIKSGHHDSSILAPHDHRHGGIKMGVPDDFCDNGKNNLGIDWNMKDNSLYSCTLRIVAPLSPGSKPVWHCTNTEYEPRHKCMNETITYKETIPLSGAHRPLWPVYGEYLYLPPQRWVHSLEHGAVVMLYHPCARREEVDVLKNIVRGCLKRHIITPYKKLPLSAPYALVTYKCRLTMDHVDIDTVVEFIRHQALQAPERRVWRDGDYSFGILHHAETVPGSDKYDSVICPALNQFKGGIRNINVPSK